MNTSSSAKGAAAVVRAEISGYGTLRKIPIVVNYIFESFVEEHVPSFIKSGASRLYGVFFFGVSAFSVSLLPMLYIYNCEKGEADSLLAADTT